MTVRNELFYPSQQLLVRSPPSTVIWKTFREENVGGRSRSTPGGSEPSGSLAGGWVRQYVPETYVV